MIPFLSLDECLRLVADNKLTKTNHGRVEAIEFEQSYFRNEASGSIRIARTDKSDFYTKFEQKNYELLCPAVPKDFEIKDRAAFEERKTKITMTKRMNVLVELKKKEGTKNREKMLLTDLQKQKCF